MNRFVVISGCSGGGKSTLLRELGQRGHGVVDEPGRRIVEQELSRQGSALPWVDAIAFAHRALERALADRAAAEHLPGWVFFDRSVIDAAAALEHLTDGHGPDIDALPRYHDTVFLTPPWPEIYVTDHERRHSFDDAVAEYQRLLLAYPVSGYDVSVLDKGTVGQRADAILATLARSTPAPN
ncbi:AAA family ATPase [Sphingomonas sp. ERG5]|uniref:AAA family ATPase n=1 Tax=Sphingomonas sp. ERG5 TaxID=1381597 RepID=UPI00054C11A0|nr:AAA family ATPase [Sphingomonas sp. ERG5]